MRVVVIGNVPPPHGGISVHVIALHRFLARRGIDCRILDIEPTKRTEAVSSRVAALRVRGPFHYLLRVLFFSARGFLLHLHTNGHNLKSWLAIGVTLWSGIPFGRRHLVTIHSGLSPDYIRGASGWIRFLMRSSLFAGGRAIVVNAEIQRALEELGVPKQRTVVLAACALEEMATALPQEIEAFRLRSSPFVSATVFFEPEYGAALLIEAMAKIRKRRPDLGIVLMGSGPGEERIRELVQVTGMERNCLLAGDLPHPVCLKVMAASSLFIRPAHFDGDSISVREALALGIPVVASDAGQRPAGVNLFRRRDVHDLAKQVERVLGGLAENRPPSRRDLPLSEPVQREAPDSGALHMLYNLYHEME